MASNEKRTLQIEARLRDFLSRDLTKVERTIVKFGVSASSGFRRVLSAATSLRSQVLAVVATFGALQAASLVRGVGEQADALLKLAAATGDVVENLSELDAAAKLSGLEDLDGILRVLVQQTRKAIDGNDEAVASFKALGISVADLQTLAPSQVFERLAAGLEQFGTQGERAVALSRILPRQVLQALPLLGNGLAAFQRAIVDAREAGATVTQNQAAISERLNDSLTKVGIATSGVGRSLIEAFGPKLTGFLEQLAREITNNRDLFVDLARTIGEVVVRAIGLAGDAVVGLIRTIESIPFVSLVDKDKLNGEIQLLRTQLAKVREAANPTPRDQLGLATLPGGGVRRGSIDQAANRAERIAAQAELEFIREVEANREQILREIAPREAEIRQRLQELESVLASGLAGSLERVRERIRASIDSVALDLQAAGATAAAGKAPDPAAGEAGLPSIQSWEAYAAQFGAAMQKVEASGKAAQSVLRATPQNQAVVVTEPQATLGEQSELQDASKLLETLAKVNPALVDVRNRLIDVEAAAQRVQLEKAFAAGKLSASELALALAQVEQGARRARAEAVQLEGSFGSGLSKALEGLTRQAASFAETAGAALGTVAVAGVDGLSNAIGDVIAGTKSAKDAFRDFALAFLQDLARMIARLLVLAAIKTAFGLEGGGVVAFEDGGVQRFATGGVSGGTARVNAQRRPGVVNGPTILYGEGRNSEAFVPLPDNRSIPVSFVGGGPQTASQTVNITIQAMDSRDVRRALAENEETLQALFVNQSRSRQGMRQAIRRSVA